MSQVFVFSRSLLAHLLGKYSLMRSMGFSDAHLAELRRQIEEFGEIQQPAFALVPPADSPQYALLSQYANLVDAPMVGWIIAQILPYASVGTPVIIESQVTQSQPEGYVPSPESDPLGYLQYVLKYVDFAAVKNLFSQYFGDVFDFPSFDQFLQSQGTFKKVLVQGMTRQLPGFAALINISTTNDAHLDFAPRLAWPEDLFFDNFSDNDLQALSNLTSDMEKILARKSQIQQFNYELRKLLSFLMQGSNPPAVSLQNHYDRFPLALSKEPKYAYVTIMAMIPYFFDFLVTSDFVGPVEANAKDSWEEREEQRAEEEIRKEIELLNAEDVESLKFWDDKLQRSYELIKENFRLSVQAIATMQNQQTAVIERGLQEKARVTIEGIDLSFLKAKNTIETTLYEKEKRLQDFLKTETLKAVMGNQKTTNRLQKVETMKRAFQEEISAWRQRKSNRARIIELFKALLMFKKSDVA